MSKRYRLNYDASIQRLLSDYHNRVTVTKSPVHEEPKDIENVVTNDKISIESFFHQSEEDTVVESTNSTILSTDEQVTAVRNAVKLSVDTAKIIVKPEIKSTKQQMSIADKAKLKQGLCLGNDCKKKFQNDCVNRLCFICCYNCKQIDQFKSYCPAHEEKALKRQRKYISFTICGFLTLYIV
jgi:hypothetical protein